MAAGDGGKKQEELSPRKLIAQIRKLLRARDNAMIDQAVMLAASVNATAAYEGLFEGCSIDENGKIRLGRVFAGSGPACVFTYQG